MSGLKGNSAKELAEYFACLYGVRLSSIYRITADVRPKRSTRSDKGNRSFAITPENEGVWKASQLIVVDKLDPLLAMKTVKLRNPEANLPSLAYFQKMLREVRLGAKQRKNPRRPHRTFEAERPAQIFQIDVTALKMRWKDERSRTVLHIEGIDKNHPELAEQKLRCWQILLVDDFSRRRFCRYVTAPAITSAEMVRFECEAFQLLGVPEIEYTDQGGEFKKDHKRAEQILNELPTIKATGGFRHMPHTPHNPQATGKVEVGHRWAEMMDRLIGLAINEGQSVKFEDLNIFADSICDEYNDRRHSETNEKPIDRWYSIRIDQRILPAEVIESALLSQPFNCLLNADMSIKVGGVKYRVPGVRPFVNFIEQKVSGNIPANIDLIILELPDKTEWQIEKILFTADKAGDYKRAAETTAEQIVKALRIDRKADIKAIRERKNLTGIIEPVPHFNVAYNPESKPIYFPHNQKKVSIEELNSVISVASEPGAVATGSSDAAASQIRNPAASYAGREFSYWEAVAEYGKQVRDKEEFKAALREQLYPNGEGKIAADQIEQLLENLHAPQPLLRAVS